MRQERRASLAPAASSGRLVARGRMQPTDGSDYGRYWTQDDSDALVNYARRKFSAQEADVEQTISNPVLDFVDKVKRAWKIFFPPQPRALNAREEGKNRLRMILVADRCGLDPVCLTEMKSSIMDAVSEYVEIDSDEEVEISMTSDDETGLIYSVAVPVRRVKPDKRASLAAFTADEVPAEDTDEKWDDDPAARFPYGT